jgi:predicted nucleic acid-binding protein
METSIANLRVMIDSTVLIAGVVWPRWSHEVLQQAVQGKYRLVLTNYVIEQARGKIRSKFPSYLSLFEEFLQEARYEIADNPNEEQIEQNKGLVRDITDIPIAIAAINAKVDFLVSEDKDLTARDETTQEMRKHLTVLFAGTFLREVLNWTGDDLENVRKRTWQDLEENER